MNDPEFENKIDKNQNVKQKSLKSAVSAKDRMVYLFVLCIFVFPHYLCIASSHTLPVTLAMHSLLTIAILLAGARTSRNARAGNGSYDCQARRCFHCLPLHVAEDFDRRRPHRHSPRTGHASHYCAGRYVCMCACVHVCMYVGPNGRNFHAMLS